MNRKLERLSRQLDEARRTGIAVPQLTEAVELEVGDAYAVQHVGVALRAAAGEQVSGVKLGFTSKAKAAQMGVSDVIMGTLTDAMAVPNGGSLDLSRGIQPRIEPEVAFRLCRPVHPGDVDGLLAAVDAVAPALEVIDSRYRDFRFSIKDVVADNASASAYVVGPWIPFDATAASDPDVRAQPVEMMVDGQLVASGSTADILGDPLEALSVVAKLSSQYGHRLLAKAVVLAGAATAAVELLPGRTIVATIENLGSVSLRATKFRQ